jgi:hypothetical protein
VGLAVKSNMFSVWTCPNRPGFPVFETISANNEQWVIGYQYFGGVTNWVNPQGNFGNAPSPVKLSSSKPNYVLAADSVMKIGSPMSWGGMDSDPARAFIYSRMPQHCNGNGGVPAGGNQVFADGSAQWIKFEKMFFLTSWRTGDRAAFFYQDPSTFSQMRPQLTGNQLTLLSAMRWRSANP